MTKQSKYGIASPTARNDRKSEGLLHGVYTERIEYVHNDNYVEVMRITIDCTRKYFSIE